jgi:hypothetical protein
VKFFISYSHKDRKKVHHLAFLLTEMGRDPEYDAEFRGGSHWWDEILTKIENSEVFLCVLSPNYINSAICQQELDYAIALNKPILPLQIRSCNLPSVVREKHCIMGEKLSLESIARRVESGLKEIEEAIQHKKFEIPDPLPPRPVWSDPLREWRKRVYEMTSSSTPIQTDNAIAVVTAIREVRDNFPSLADEASQLLNLLRNEPKAPQIVVQEIENILEVPRKKIRNKVLIGSVVILLVSVLSIALYQQVANNLGNPLTTTASSSTENTITTTSNSASQVEETPRTPAIPETLGYRQVFAQDFEDGTMDGFIEPTEINVSIVSLSDETENQALRFTTNREGSIRVSGEAWSNFWLSFRVQYSEAIPSNTEFLWVSYRQSWENSVSYILGLGQPESVFNYYIGPNWQNLAHGPYEILPNQWYQIDLHVNENQFEFSIDGLPLLSTVSEVEVSDSGRIMWTIPQSDTPVFIDDVEIWVP